jgi:hypothetical protein
MMKPVLLTVSPPLHVCSSLPHKAVAVTLRSIHPPGHQSQLLISCPRAMQEVHVLDDRVSFLDARWDRPLLDEDVPRTTKDDCLHC